jgi:hypothetical protein
MFNTKDEDKTMTKKDYEKFADMFASYEYEPQGASDRELGFIDAARIFSAHLCHIFAADNPRFDRSSFLKACGIEE